MQDRKRKTLVIAGYVAAIAVIAIAAMVIDGGLFAQAQPIVSVAYNSVTGDSMGYINNTLSYPIVVYGFYCVVNGQRYEFSDAGGQTVAPGSKSTIYFYGNATSANETPPGYTSCMKWSIIYNASGVAEGGQGAV